MGMRSSLASDALQAGGEHVKVAIIGGGAGGLLTGPLLARDGHDVTVLERDSEPPPSSNEFSRAETQLEPVRFVATLGSFVDLPGVATVSHRDSNR